jgi:hypothetical protein
MLTQSIFNHLAGKYSCYGSWAVWNPDDQADTSVITENVKDLKNSVIVVGLNCSGRFAKRAHRHLGNSVEGHEGWQNFHGGKQDRKLMYALNDSPYRGAYLTDVIKGEFDVSSANVRERIDQRLIDIGKHVTAFRDEMNDWAVDSNALFILLGGTVEQLFKGYLAPFYKNHVRVDHYARRGTDAEYVHNVWQELEKHYEDTKAKYNTLQFARNTPMTSLLEALKRK